MPVTPPLNSKLPQVGTTIFSTMSQLAAEHQAINLSQGFPDYDGPASLLERVDYHIRQGANQYAPMTGVPQLRKALQAKLLRCYDRKVDADTEITVTSGATEALFAAIACSVRPGDEVIIFDPAYDSYEPAINLNGGTAIRLPLLPPDFRINWDQVATALTPKTRMLILNSPHNPSGQILYPEDIQALQQLVANTQLLILADEVYEHMVFDQQRHLSLNLYPDLAARSFIVSSFGKTYHITGWKVGYCVAPATLTAELRKVHQYLTFSTATPLQRALADHLHAHPEEDQRLNLFYQQKRDFFNHLLAPGRFAFTPSAGTYFQLMDYSAISQEEDTQFIQSLITQAQVAAIPLSVFYQHPPEQLTWVRFCFAKHEKTLEAAASKLLQL
ncbi:methionine aminotransferase [Marinospirillum celere]|uniref:Methionine aminotransferase n=2 Tax=Marinospirillum celere TaxID=1122252 RepID=A0A1I1HG01_9GAMM|nr:methionine aminotransferase [Marinospirillum celere]